MIYLNAFSGDATTEFPSTLQMARGGVCCCFSLLSIVSYHLDCVSVFDIENKIEDFGRFYGAWEDYYDYSSPSELH